MSFLMLAALLAAASSADEESVPFAVAGPEGFGISSPDGASRLITHWLLQSDFRAFLNEDKPTPDRETFMFRFGGIRLDAILERTFRANLFANFAQNQVTLLEGWIEARLNPWLRLRAGKFNYPISEERLTPGINLPFVSTGVASMLLPPRDTGVQLLGSLGDTLVFNLAVTNGAMPGGAGDTVGDSGKDLVARIYARPFGGFEPLRQLGLGVGASTGRHTGTRDNGRLLTLQSYGSQIFFSYAKGVAANGLVQRVVPHLTWGYGPLSVYADAVWTRERISGVEVSSRAWSAIGTIVLTGEQAVPLGFVIPRGRYGAVVLVWGVGEVQIGANAFPSLADPLTAMKGMTVYGGGVNWYLARGVALLASYGHQIFETAGAGPKRPDEDTLIVRLQLTL